MPEYLAPGVYIEETSFRSKSIEGVGTSTAGFVGPARFGPVSGDPELITSLADFERIYGSLDDLTFGTRPATPNYLAHAVRSFFEEGGRRLYVSRVFRPSTANFGITTATGPGSVPTAHYARATQRDGATGPPPATPPVTLVARFPGSGGNMRVTITLRAGANALNRNAPGGPTLTRVQSGGLVHARVPGSGATAGSPQVTTNGLAVAVRDPASGQWSLVDETASPPVTTAVNAALPANIELRPLTITVEVARQSGRPPAFGGAELIGDFGFDQQDTASFPSTFVRNPTTRLHALTIPFAVELSGTPVQQALLRDLAGAGAITALLDNTPVPATLRVSYTLAGGNDGDAPTAGEYEGRATGFVDYQNIRAQLPKNGLLAFEPVEDIAIIAAPGHTAPEMGDDDAVGAIQNTVINHCERMRYRIAVLDSRRDQLVTGALAFRNRRSSDYAAIYYPWVWVADPLGGGRLLLPPSGFVAGIYARNDIEHAVFKAPANEVVRLAIDFEQRLSKAHQEVLNPEGVNCFRFFEGRGFLLWGARTISDDPEWKYVNLRRYFAYMEHSIDRGTQWVVFENNSRQLWDNVRRTVEDFLLNEWKMGGLMGDKPEQAYFVRCDMTTMTQNDIDNGRLVCLIGVAPVRPAEFVIFRIGQWTATTNR